MKNYDEIALARETLRSVGEKMQNDGSQDTEAEAVIAMAFGVLGWCLEEPDPESAKFGRQLERWKAEAASARSRKVRYGR